jgi:hypothetical protein
MGVKTPPDKVSSRPGRASGDTGRPPVDDAEDDATLVTIRGDWTRIGSALKSVAAAFDRVSISPDLGKLLVAGVEAYRTALSVLAPHGWLVGFEYTPAEASAILDVLHREGLPAVEARLLADFRSTPCEEHARRLSGPALDGWGPVLEMAGRAHDRGEYPLAIPIWLSATDGLCQRYLGNLHPFKVQNVAKGRARQAIERLAPTGSIGPAAARALVTVLMGFGGRGGAAVLNRHEILHGTKPPRGDERDSAQCVIALRLMLALLEKLAPR